MTKESDEATVAVWTGLMRAQRLAMAKVEARLKAAELPQLSWYDALWELEKAGEEGLRPFELERAMLFEQYNLSRLVDRLVRAGLVERCVCPQDKRGHVLRISSEGRALRRDMWEVYAPAMAEAVGERLTSAEAEALSSLLKKLG